jgi:hypothetical protein
MIDAASAAGGMIGKRNRGRNRIQSGRTEGVNRT